MGSKWRRISYIDKCKNRYTVNEFFQLFFCRVLDDGVRRLFSFFIITVWIIIAWIISCCIWIARFILEDSFIWILIPLKMGIPICTTTTPKIAPIFITRQKQLLWKRSQFSSLEKGACFKSSICCECNTTTTLSLKFSKSLASLFTSLYLFQVPVPLSPLPPYFMFQGSEYKWRKDIGVDESTIQMELNLLYKMAWEMEPSRRSCSAQYVTVQ